MATDVGRKQTGFLWRYTLQSIGLVLLLAALIRFFLLSSYVMSGASMLPSVWPGDFLLAARNSLGQPQRGQLYVLRCPAARERICLRRLIGLPGDRLEFRDGRLWLNGRKIQFKSISVDFARESFEGESWAIWPSPAEEVMKLPVVVPPGHIFVLNDKRSDSEDGRQWGPVSADLLEARPLLVWLSLDWFNSSGELRDWPRVRWARLLRRLD